MYIVHDPTKVYASTDVQEFATHTIGWDFNGKGYMFVKGKASTTIIAGDVCGIEEDGQASEATITTSAPGTGAGLPVGVGISTIAAGGWGWLQVYGIVAAVQVVSDTAAHTELNTTATAGRIDDDATSGAEVVAGLTITGAVTSNLAAGYASWPYFARTL